MKYEKIYHNINPIYNENSRFLILGSMPSVLSRENDFYYSHPQNKFWQVLSAVFDVSIPYNIADKEKLILNNSLALWDVLASCEIKGSNDSSIKNPVANDFSELLKNSKIDHIFTTGAQAFKLYMKLCFYKIKIEPIQLPSTSPANQGRFPLNLLIEKYMILRDLQRPMYSSEN